MWESRPNHLQLLPQEIQLWKANLDITDDLVSEFWATLSDSEKSRANRFRFPQHRRHFIAGRGILRHLLSQYLQLPAMDFLINYGPQGKPFLPDFPDFSFNISHSKNHALLAFAQKMTIGVDVECLDPTIEFEVIPPNFFSKLGLKRGCLLF